MDNLRCPHCGAFNTSDSVFCEMCGSKLNVSEGQTSSDRKIYHENQPTLSLFEFEDMLGEQPSSREPTSDNRTSSENNDIYSDSGSDTNEYRGYPNTNQSSDNSQYNQYQSANRQNQSSDNSQYNQYQSANRQNQSFAADTSQQYSSDNGNFSAGPKKNINKSKLANYLIITVSVLLFLVVCFTGFTILVCKDVIDSDDKTSFIEKYESKVFGIFNKDNTDEGSETAVIEQSTTEYNESTVWNTESETTEWTTQITTTAETTFEENTVSSGNTYRVVTEGDNLNLRESPSADSDWLEQIPKDTKIVITRIEKGWGYTSYNGTYGWVKMDYVETVD